MRSVHFLDTNVKGGMELIVEEEDVVPLWLHIVREYWALQ